MKLVILSMTGVLSEMVPEEEESQRDNKYMGYRIDDLSESLGAVLGKDNVNKYSEFELESISWMNLMPSLYTILVLIYFVLLVCILYGISSFMFKKYDIKTKSESKKIEKKNELLGGYGKYAKYVNTSIAFKIYQEEMEKMDDSNDDDSNDDDDDDDDKSNDDNLILESTLIGGYNKKPKKLRLRNIRKQKLREQKENYLRYKKKLKFEKQLKRYNKIKEKKYEKKMIKKNKIKKKIKNKKNKNDENGAWFKSIYNSIINKFKNNDNNDDNIDDDQDDEKKNDEIEIDEMKIDEIKCTKNDNKNDNKAILKEMIINDCCNDIIIDLNKYYLNKIKGSDIYSSILPNLNSFRKYVKNLCFSEKECQGLIDENLNIYFRWNQQCNNKLFEWIQITGKCNLKLTANKMLQISKETFS